MHKLVGNRDPGFLALRIGGEGLNGNFGGNGRGAALDGDLGPLLAAGRRSEFGGCEREFRSATKMWPVESMSKSSA
jgi:hypothetical protein